MNRSLSAPGFDAAEPGFPALEETVLPGVAGRLSFAPVAELARRFSGVVAIAVLGAAMVALALRAEDEASPASSAAPALSPAAEASDAPSPAAPSTGFSSATYTLPERTIVYYLYDTEAKRQMILLAESVAGQEIATETVTPTFRQFFALDASTPEDEQAARDTIFEATIAGGSETRVIVHDLRDTP